MSNPTGHETTATGLAGLEALPRPWNHADFREAAEAVLNHFPRPRNALLPLMEVAASQAFLTPETLAPLAHLCETAPAEAETVARLYGLLSEPGTAHRVTVCVHIHCRHDGSERLLGALRNVLAGRPVRVDTRRCLGYCGEGPCVKVDGEVLTGADVTEVVKRVEE